MQAIRGFPASSIFNRVFNASYLQSNRYKSKNVLKLRDLEAHLNLPESPKRPIPPYIQFTANTFKELKKTPTPTPTKFKEVISMIKQKWDALDESTRAQMNQDFLKKLAEYSEAKIKYQQSLTNEQREKLEAARKEVRFANDVTSFSKPKKPVNGWALFIKDQYAAGRNDLSTSGKENFKKFAAEYKQLNPEAKAEYDEKVKQLKAHYEEELVMWEAEMVKHGHENLVRKKSSPRGEVVAAARKATKRKPEKGAPAPTSG